MFLQLFSIFLFFFLFIYFFLFSFFFQVYMVWNSLNDPLIAYYMDSAHWEEDSRTPHRGKGGKVRKKKEKEKIEKREKEK